MQVTITRMLLCALVSFAGAAAFAQNAQLVSHMQFAELQQDVDGELAALKARLVSLESGDMSALQKGGCESCCCDCWCNPCCGYIAEAEVLLLRPHNPEGQTSSNQYQTGSRWTFGTMDDCGRSWRVRYFEYFHNNFDGSTLNLETIDLEYAARFRLGCNWHGEIAAGLRWAEYRDPANVIYDSTIGPVISAELRNPIWCDIDLVARARQSLQFGEYDDGGFEGHGTFSVTELYLGAEATRCVGGNNMFIRGGLESQYWAGPDDQDNEDVGLIGLGIAVGLAR